MTRYDDPRLLGRHPEFARMSLKPGIGADMVDEVASTLMQFNLEDSAQGDVPSSLRHGTRMMPLGRYLTRRLRTRVGKEANAPQETISARALELLPMFKAARASKENPSAVFHLVEAAKSKVASQLARLKIRKQRKSL